MRTDEQLLAAAARGDDRAFAAFYRRHLDGVVARAAAGAEPLRAALDALPEPLRAALLARVVQERSYPEIAAELDCSEHVVRQRVHRGLARLRAGLEDGDERVR